MADKHLHNRRKNVKCIKQTIADIATPKATPKDTILSLIGQNSRITVKEMAEALGMNKRNAQIHVKKLTEQGLIRHVGASRGGHWEIIGG